MKAILKHLIHPGTYDNRISSALLILRVITSVMMLTHGLPKLGKLFGDGPLTFADPLGIGTETTLVLAILAEVAGSILVIVGMGTRMAVVPLMITMAVAAFIVHAGDPFGKMELPILYMTAYLVLFITGSGKFSLDHLLYGKVKMSPENRLRSFGVQPL